jgi:hypothetical protein
VANHIRQQIRAAAATLLAGLSSTGSRVFASQYYALAAADLPALLVYTPEEDSSQPPPRCHPGELRRVITLHVEGVVTGTGNLADALDQVALEVEERMASDFTLGATCKSLQLTGTTLTTRGADSPQPIGAVVMKWEAVATTVEGVPDELS